MMMVVVIVVMTVILPRHPRAVSPQVTPKEESFRKTWNPKFTLRRYAALYSGQIDLPNTTWQRLATCLVSTTSGRFTKQRDSEPASVRPWHDFRSTVWC